MKGDKNSSNAQLLQKALARSSKAPSQEDSSRAMTAWSKAAGYTSQHIDALTDQEIQFQNAHHTYESAMKQRKADNQQLNDNAAVGEEKEKAANSDDDFEEDLDELNAIREKRIAALKKGLNATSELKSLGHGSYSEIVQDEFLTSVTGSKFAVCHFYHRDFERCKIIDKHLELIAKEHLECRFVKLNAEKAPFFIQKLKVKVLPSILLFKDGIAIDRIVGFDDLGATDEFTTQTLAKRISNSGVIRWKNQPANDANSNGNDKLQTNARSRIVKGKAFTALEDDDSSDDD